MGCVFNDPERKSRAVYEMRSTANIAIDSDLCIDGYRFVRIRLHGVTVIKTDVSGEKRNLVAIPYYAWSHRGPGEMAVWLNRE